MTGTGRAASSVVDTMRTLLDQGWLDLPLPGGGRTVERLSRLRDLGSDDLVVARLAEAHTDALAVLADLGAVTDVPAGRSRRSLWGVWAADPPGRLLRADVTAAAANTRGWTLTGDKPWCSGATLCDRALVTAHAPDGYRLFVMDPRHAGVEAMPSRWAATGMHGSDTRDLHLERVPARAVGSPGAYLDRPGFWWGGAGVAAVWLGGAQRVSRTLERVAAKHGSDLALASLGRVDAAQNAAWAALVQVGELADERGRQGPVPPGADRLAAARARAAVETAVEVTLHETARTAGPGPLATDADHVRAVADLQVYVRQSHGDRDLAELGTLVLEQRAGDQAAS